MLLFGTRALGVVDLVQRKFNCRKIERRRAEYRGRLARRRLQCRLRFGREPQQYLLLGRALLVGLSAVISVVGRAGRSSLLLTKSLSRASHFKRSSAGVSQVMSPVKSLFSLLDLSGCT